MTIEDIKKVVDDYSGIDIARDVRKDVEVFYRNVYYYFCKKYVFNKLDSEIAKLVNRDRNSFRYGLEKLENSINFQKEQVYIVKLSEIENILISNFEETKLVLCHYNVFDKMDAIRDSLRVRKKNKQLRLKYNKLIKQKT